MADGVFNIAKGAAAEMFRDSAPKGIVMLLKANEVEATLVDYADVVTQGDVAVIGILPAAA